MDDLKQRLRGPVPHTKGFSEIFVDIDRNKAERIEAAAALDAKDAETERLRVLLGKLADLYEHEAGRGQEMPLERYAPELAEARAALAGKE